MKTAVSKMLVAIFYMISTVACLDNGDIVNEISRQTFYFDIIGNTDLDKIELSYLDKGRTKVTLPDGTILILLPRLDATYLNTEPRAENIYLEANDVQSSAKGLRIKIRNTDLIPDYVYFDIRFKNKYWYLINYGIINTIVEESVFIKNKEVKKKLNQVAQIDQKDDKVIILDPKNFWSYLTY